MQKITRKFNVIKGGDLLLQREAGPVSSTDGHCVQDVVDAGESRSRAAQWQGISPGENNAREKQIFSRVPFVPFFPSFTSAFLLSGQAAPNA